MPDDPNHARVTEWFAANNELLVTSDYCIDETLTLLMARKRPQLALRAGEAFFADELGAIVGRYRRTLRAAAVRPVAIGKR